MKNKINLRVKSLLNIKSKKTVFDVEQYLVATSFFNLRLSDESFKLIVNKAKLKPDNVVTAIDKTCFTIDAENDTPAVHKYISRNALLKKYFSDNPKAVEEKIVELINDGLLAEKDFASLLERIVSTKQKTVKSDFNRDISKRNIYHLVRNNDRVKNVFTKQDKMYKLELANLSDDFLNDETLAKEAYSDKIVESYIRVCACVDNNVDIISKAWYKYVPFCADYGLKELPEELLQINDFYIKASDFFKFRLNSEKKSEIYCNYAIQVFKKILNQIDENDIPSLLLLGRIYQMKDDFESAEKYLLRACAQFNGMTALVDLYESEIRKSLKRNNSKNLYELICKTEKLYKAFLEKINNDLNRADNIKQFDEMKENYIVLTSKYGRFKCNRCEFDTCFDVLENVRNRFADSAEIYRVYTELGLLYQVVGKKGIRNPYHDKGKAIEMLKAADEAAKENLKCQNNPHIRKYMLMPLANTYYLNGNYNEALGVCDEILAIDRTEKRARQLIDKIMVHAAA